MDSDGDPFRLWDDEPTTFIPSPGGLSRRKPSGMPEAMSPHITASNVSAAGTPGRGPLVQSAFGLLSTAPLLRAHTPPKLPEEQLRAQIEGELRAFADSASTKGVDQRLIAVAQYSLCALVDDVILNTPWSVRWTWRANSLAVARYRDSAAGERFFDHLNEAKRQLERNRPLLELMAICLALGFEGQYRLLPNGQVALQKIREELTSILRRLDGEIDGALSGHWRGVAAAHVPIIRRVPVWVYASAALGSLILIYAAFAVRLGDVGGRLDVVVAGLPPAGPVGIIRPVSAPPPPPPTLTLEPQLRTCLPEPTRNQAEAVTETLQGLRIRLPDAGLFASSSADLRPEITQVIVCVANILKKEEGRVSVVGHSDNIPIRTVRFPSNWELSKARAEAVAAVARPIMGEGRIEVAGRADSEPIASNTIEDGRSRNRRVEVLLLR